MRPAKAQKKCSAAPPSKSLGTPTQSLFFLFAQKHRNYSVSQIPAMRHTAINKWL